MEHSPTEESALDLESQTEEAAEMTELMKAHLDAVTGGASHSSWRASSPHF